jgi:hypothetical protein
MLSRTGSAGTGSPLDDVSHACRIWVRRTRLATLLWHRRDSRTTKARARRFLERPAVLSEVTKTLGVHGRHLLLLTCREDHASEELDVRLDRHHQKMRMSRRMTAMMSAIAAMVRVVIGGSPLGKALR